MKNASHVSNTNSGLSLGQKALATGGLLLAAGGPAFAAGEPVTGNAAMDAVVVVLAAAIVAIGVFSGGGAAIKAGVAVFGKVMKYFSKSV